MEIVVAAALIGAMGLTTLGVLRSSTVLSSQNAGINISASRAREVIDQINNRARYSLAQPDLINTDGTDASGTTSDGIKIKVFSGGPYVLKESGGTTADVADTATQFTIEYRTGLPDPAVGDSILVDSVTRPELEISAVGALSANGTTLRKLITTTTAIGEFVRPQYYRVGAALYHEEAYVFLPTDTSGNPRFQLRHYSRVKGNTNFATPANFNVMTDGYRRLQNLSFFASTTSNGQETTLVRALANSSNRQEYVSRGSATSTFTSVPLQVRLWALNRN